MVTLDDLWKSVFSLKWHLHGCEECLLNFILDRNSIISQARLELWCVIISNSTRYSDQVPIINSIQCQISIKFTVSNFMLVLGSDESHVFRTGEDKSSVLWNFDKRKQPDMVDSRKRTLEWNFKEDEMKMKVNAILNMNKEIRTSPMLISAFTAWLIPNYF